MNKWVVSTRTACLALVFLVCPALFGSTWYVRPDGGTRYTKTNPAGQCDGTADAAFSGSGTDRHCAFKDVRFLWTDGSYTTDQTGADGKWKWIGSGGDTYLIRGSIADHVSYRVGANGPGPKDSFGLAGNPYGAGAPLPPAGSIGAHTRILGGNFASCAAPAAKTQLHGGYGVSNVLNLAGASYVDVACLDITDFSSCGKSGQANGCKTGYPLDDFASNGIALSRQTTHTNLTDLRIHGLAVSGIQGATGDGVVMTGLEVLGNASAGWNADSGDGTTGTGSLLVQKFNLSWNGCAEEYPQVHSLPYTDCTDQEHGGYGDGFGTATVASVPGWQAHFDQGVVSYNTQDGLDALHLIGTGSSMTITRVLAFGNIGQQIKVGGASGTAVNNLIVGSCQAMAGNIPGTPSGFNKRLGPFCRAGDETVLVTAGRNATLSFDNNTIYSAGRVGIELECDTSSGECDSTSKMLFRNNVFVGFPNDAKHGYPRETATGEYPTLIYTEMEAKVFRNSGSEYSHNVTYRQRPDVSCPVAPYEKDAVCGRPGLIDETYHLYGYGNMAPASAESKAANSGMSVPDLTVDFAGISRTATPSRGALEPGSAERFPEALPPGPVKTGTPQHAGSTRSPGGRRGRLTRGIVHYAVAAFLVVLLGLIVIGAIRFLSFGFQRGAAIR